MTFRCGYLISLFLLTINWPPFSPIAHQIAEKPRETWLQLSTTITSQRYCKGDADINVLQLKLRLRFTNTTDRSLILYKPSPLLHRVLVSRSPEAAVARRFETNASLSTFRSGDVNVETQSPSSLFKVLAQGKTHETDLSVPVFVARDDKKENEGVIHSGEYVLQIGVETWPQTADLAKRMHQRWQSIGFLWYENVTSTPMWFKVQPNVASKNCQ